MHKLMNKDKIILRFTCCMVDTDNTKLGHSDAERVFVLSYFLMDDTLSIYEPPIRNSGVVGGKFLERSKVRLKRGQGQRSSCRRLVLRRQRACSEALMFIVLPNPPCRVAVRR